MSTWLWWSSGKDSAHALAVLRARGVEVSGLVTTLVEASGRVAVHDVDRALLDAQAAAAGIPLRVVPLPRPCPNAVYERAVAGLTKEALAAGVDTMAFGDLFLEDIRDYRCGLFEGSGLAVDFPIWDPDTARTADIMLASGLRATVTCVDERVLPASVAGREWSRELLAELPDGVDPCGENGEFHTFAWAGPAFARDLRVRAGPVTTRDGFAFAALAPA